MGIVEVRRRVGRIITRLYQPLHRQIRRFAKVGGIEGLRPNRMRKQDEQRQGKGKREMPERALCGSANHRADWTSCRFQYNLPDFNGCPRSLAFGDRGGTRSRTRQRLVTASRRSEEWPRSACCTGRSAHSSAQSPAPSASAGRPADSSSGCAHRAPSSPAPRPHGIHV